MVRPRRSVANTVVKSEDDAWNTKEKKDAEEEVKSPSLSPPTKRRNIEKPKKLSESESSSEPRVLRSTIKTEDLSIPDPDPETAPTTSHNEANTAVPVPEPEADKEVGSLMCMEELHDVSPSSGNSPQPLSGSGSRPNSTGSVPVSNVTARVLANVNGIVVVAGTEGGSRKDKESGPSTVPSTSSGITTMSTPSSSHSSSETVVQRFKPTAYETQMSAVLGDKLLLRRTAKHLSFTQLASAEGWEQNLQKTGMSCTVRDLAKAAIEKRGNAYAAVIAQPTWEHPVWTEPLRGILITLIEQQSLEFSDQQPIAVFGRNMTKFKNIATILANQDSRFTDAVVLEAWLWMCEMFYRQFYVRQYYGQRCVCWRFANSMKFVNLSNNVFIGVLSEERFEKLCTTVGDCGPDDWKLVNEYRKLVVLKETLSLNSESLSAGQLAARLTSVPLVVQLDSALPSESSADSDSERAGVRKTLLQKEQALKEAQLVRDFSRLCGLPDGSSPPSDRWTPELVYKLVSLVKNEQPQWDPQTAYPQMQKELRTVIVDVAARLRKGAEKEREWMTDDACWKRWTELCCVVNKLKRRQRVEIMKSAGPLAEFYRLITTFTSSVPVAQHRAPNKTPPAVSESGHHQEASTSGSRPSSAEESKRSSPAVVVAEVPIFREVKVEPEDVQEVREVPVVREVRTLEALLKSTLPGPSSPAPAPAPIPTPTTSTASASVSSKQQQPMTAIPVPGGSSGKGNLMLSQLQTLLALAAQKSLPNSGPPIPMPPGSAGGGSQSEQVWVPPREEEVLHERQKLQAALSSSAGSSGTATATATVVVKPLESSAFLPNGSASTSNGGARTKTPPKPTTANLSAIQVLLNSAAYRQMTQQEQLQFLLQANGIGLNSVSHVTASPPVQHPVPSSHASHEDKWTLFGRVMAEHARELERLRGPVAALEYQKAITDLTLKQFKQ